VLILQYRHPVRIMGDFRELRIVIPYWNGWGTFLFAVFWNLINAQVGYGAWQDIQMGKVGQHLLDTLHFSEIGAVCGLSMLVWIAMWQEVITLDAEYLCIRRGILGWGWSKTYQLTDVEKVYASFFLHPKARGHWQLKFLYGGLFFKYRGKLVSFGDEISTKDAVKIEEAIEARVVRTGC
jgi:hypothetical protein